MSGKDEKESENRSSEEILSCGTSLTIADAESLYQRLRSLLDGGAPVVIEAHEVESIDTSALQLLGAFLQESGSHGISVRWQNPSETLLAAAQRLDMNQLLMLEA